MQFTWQKLATSARCCRYAGEMMDPALEQLHSRSESFRSHLPAGRAARLEIALSGLLLVAILSIAGFGPAGHWAPGWEVATLVLASAAASRVEFPVGAGATTPVMVVQIPLWFAVPPAWLPVMVGVSFVTGALPRRRGGLNAKAPLAFFDSFYSVGPAIVLAVAGAPQASFDLAPVVALAFASGAAIDVGVTVAHARWILQAPLSTALRPELWVVAVDAALAPVGFVTAVLMAEHPAAIFAVLPLVLLLGEFARERSTRIDQALELSGSYRGTAQLMGDVLEADDAYTGGEHTRGVVEMAVAVGRELRLDPRAMRDLEFGALLHDVGKLRVPNEIINKPGKLTEPEWALIREHPVYGQQMLDRVGGALTDAGRIVRAHHERWDGMGYPDRLAGEQIPIASRIITACDSFSAMTTTRSYREAMTEDQALAELDRCAGAQFDPEIVEVVRGEVLRQRAERSVAGGGEIAALPASLVGERDVLAGGADDALGLIA